MRTVNKFIFTGLFFVLAVCAFAQAQDSIVHADTTVITAQDVTVAPPDSLKAADSLQVMTDTVPPKKTKVYLILSLIHISEPRDRSVSRMPSSA